MWLPRMLAQVPDAERQCFLLKAWMTFALFVFVKGPKQNHLLNHATKSLAYKLLVIDDVDWLTPDLDMNHGESSKTNLFLVYLEAEQ